MGALHRNMKNRGLSAYISTHLPEWNLPDVFMGIDVRPFVIEHFPHATVSAVTNALGTVANSSYHGGIETAGRGAFRRKNGKAAQPPTSGDVIDNALNALALVEQALRESKAEIASFNAMMSAWQASRQKQ